MSECKHEKLSWDIGDFQFCATCGESNASILQQQLAAATAENEHLQEQVGAYRAAIEDDVANCDYRKEVGSSGGCPYGQQGCETSNACRVLDSDTSGQPLLDVARAAEEVCELHHEKMLTHIYGSAVLRLEKALRRWKP